MHAVKSPLSDAGPKTVSEALRGTPVAAPGAGVTRMQERVVANGEPDPVTRDVLLSITAGPERHHRMFRAENV
ncbi:hypothetical protein ACH4F6_15975 [Streptomyces sp. NPDC017936]|uniref:hypothetical protein n=1 Tax=Streptomyces sp. NPDC017936 TaxID=3365016 RepID=UPI0037AA9979